MDCDVGAPQVNYRESISRKLRTSDYVHKKQSGGSGQFADIAESDSSQESPAAGFEFRSEIKGGVVPKVRLPVLLLMAQNALLL